MRTTTTEKLDNNDNIYTNNMILIDGNKVAAEMKQEIAAEVVALKANGGRTPHLAAVLVGHDGGSETYVAYKIKDCEAVGFKSSLIRYEDDVTENELLAKIEELNNDVDLDGFIVQLPLPKHISEQKVIEAINPRKDVDGFHPANVGRMVIGLPSYVSATPFGIVELLKRYKIETNGKNCVIVGRSNIVGRPLSVLMSQKAVNATVTVAHSRTENLDEVCRNADILIAAIGVPGFIKGNMVKEGAVVIDVGTTRVKSDQTKSGFKLKGDVLFEEVAEKCSYITPVPGGVGPMTRVSLLQNTLLSAKGEIYK
jgi:methylenetetrahydrofolate dehydrogenase (NADP+) / methenyltetrahydrofolate cyclohydrolase